ncbi:MAG TPA: sensor domain-containing protein, partial [Diaminobutyricibacter sp.]
MTIESLSTGQPSDTLDAVSSTRPQHPARQGYSALWRGVPRELGFLVLTMPIAYVGFSILNGVLWAGVATLIIYIGVFLVSGSLYIARGFGTLELVRLRWSGQPQIARPDWNPSGKPLTFWRRVFGPYAN